MALPHFICLFGDIRRFVTGKPFFYALQKVGCETEWIQTSCRLLVVKMDAPLKQKVEPKGKHDV